MTAIEREQAIEQVKIAKAEMLFDDNIRVYGSEEAALRSLDRKTRAEAVDMLKHVMTYRFRKIDGKVIVE